MFLSEAAACAKVVKGSLFIVVEVSRICQGHIEHSQSCPGCRVIPESHHHSPSVAIPGRVSRVQG